MSFIFKSTYLPFIILSLLLFTSLSVSQDDSRDRKPPVVRRPVANGQQGTTQRPIIRSTVPTQATTKFKFTTNTIKQVRE